MTFLLGVLIVLVVLLFLSCVGLSVQLRDAQAALEPWKQAATCWKSVAEAWREHALAPSRVHLQVDGRNLAEVVVPHIPDVVKRYGVN